MCYLVCRIEDEAENTDDLFINISEETVFLYLVRKNKVMSCRSCMVCSLIPQCNNNSLILGRMLGINNQVKELCRGEGVMSVDVWNYFSPDRSLFGKDRLNLNRTEKARLRRVLDEEVRLEIRKMPVKEGVP